MNKFLASNLQTKGRIVRGGISAVLLLAALLCFSISIELATLLLVSGLFVLFEAIRGWCVLRACGIKTRI
jgi:membrane-bound ClpP family serine protease